MYTCTHVFLFMYMHMHACMSSGYQGQGCHWRGGHAAKHFSSTAAGASGDKHILELRSLSCQL